MWLEQEMFTGNVLDIFVWRTATQHLDSLQEAIENELGGFAK
jgi:hypothetical protein